MKKSLLSLSATFAVALAGCSAQTINDATAGLSSDATLPGLSSGAGLSLTEGVSVPVGYSIPAGTSSAAALSSADGLVWQQANLTNYTSYPVPGSDECILYSGCRWQGWFAALPDSMSEAWVASNNIISVNSPDYTTLRLKTLRLRQGTQTIDAVVYDKCADSDCSGCCTRNATQNGLNFLIDIEKYTMERFGGRGDGIVEWACVDC
jgi:hypothetical protein